MKVLDTVIQENDQSPEAWYLLAFSHFHLKKYKNAKECLKNVKTVMAKLKVKDKELLTGSEELMAQIQKKLGADDELSEDEQMGVEEGDEDWEDASEEDISGDEEAMMD